jgi:membrane-bound serine protease (ClpP class)
MSVILTLFAAGILLLAFEVIVPGAILGILGTVMIIIGVAVSFNQYGTDGGLVATAAALVLTGLTLYLEFVLLPKSRVAKKLSLTDTVAGTSQPEVADRKSVVGRQAVAITALVPSGYVELDGRRYEAFARDGMAQTGERLDVIDVDNFRLIVSKPTKHDSQ